MIATPEKINQLKGIFPEVFFEDQIEFDRLTKRDSDFNWKGKEECRRIIQEPSIATLKPCREESVNFDETQNLYIEGDNLDALKLLQESYSNKVKMIYIDPPYNTGKKFIYNDNYRDGRCHHSKWLNMMYPRLYLAKSLLRDDGVIFISIDDHEQHRLRMICDQIFGEENFVANIIWERAYAPVNLKRHFSPNHDYIITYSKSINSLDNIKLPRTLAANARYSNLDNDIRGIWKSGNLSVGPAIESNIYEIITPSGRKVLPSKGTSWRYSKKRLQELIADNRVCFGPNGNNVPRVKRFLSEVKDGITPLTLWRYSDVGHTQDAKKETKKLFDGEAVFDYPKPVSLINRMVQLATTENDLILDFFSGSGTTAQAVMQLNAGDGGNRKYIMVQLPEACNEKSEAYKAGYKTIADIGKERIRRAANKIKQENPDYQGDLGFKVLKLSV